MLASFLQFLRPGLLRSFLRRERFFGNAGQSHANPPCEVCYDAVRKAGFSLWHFKVATIVTKGLEQQTVFGMFTVEQLAAFTPFFESAAVIKAQPGLCFLRAVALETMV